MTGRFRPRRARARLAACAALVLAGALAACGSEPVGVEPPPAPPAPAVPSLRAVAEARGFRIGTAADRSFHLAGSEGARFREILAREFNVLTPENAMKHERLQPSRGVYDFARADSLVAFARANGMLVRGHTLVWHSQLAGWLTRGTWSRPEVEAMLDEHVARVAGHFRGRLAAWDVVNEAVESDGTLRQTFWLRHLGPEYIERAFRRAHQADPDVLLFYNDYGLEWPGAKQDAAFALLRDLKARGAPVHGIGFQAHFQVGGGVPSPQNLRATFDRFAALGLRIHVTELDVRIRQPATAASLQTQAQNYRDVVQVCLQTPTCEMVTVWGLTDRDSWVPSTFAGWGDALLFDAAYRPKPAYWSVHALLSAK